MGADGAKRGQMGGPTGANGGPMGLDWVPDGVPPSGFATILQWFCNDERPERGPDGVPVGAMSSATSFLIAMSPV
jgi:hypothetical protein